MNRLWNRVNFSEKPKITQLILTSGKCGYLNTVSDFEKSIIATLLLEHTLTVVIVNVVVCVFAI